MPSLTTLITSLLHRTHPHFISCLSNSSCQVYQVRHKASGDVYAMKVLDKEAVLRRQQLEHTLTECRVLQVIRGGGGGAFRLGEGGGGGV